MEENESKLLAEDIYNELKPVFIALIATLMRQHHSDLARYDPSIEKKELKDFLLDAKQRLETAELYSKKIGPQM
jgi:hypothetical protein